MLPVRHSAAAHTHLADRARHALRPCDANADGVSSRQDA